MTTATEAQGTIRSQPLLVLIVTVLVYAGGIVLRRSLLGGVTEAAIWQSSVIVVGLVLLTGRWRIACFIACIAVNALGNWVYGATARTFMTFPICAVMTWSVLRLVGPGLNFADPRRLALFLALGVILPCAVGALALLVIPFGGAVATEQAAVRWFIGHALGSAILIPSVSILTRPRRFKGFQGLTLEALAVFAVTLGYVGFLLWRNEQSGWDLLAFPFAMFIAFRYGPVGVSLLSLMMVALSLAHVGGVVPHRGGDALSYIQTQWVQVFIALTFLTSLPAAGAVASFQRMRTLFARRTLTARHARHRAEEAARAKGEFLANMSHEIRTPLNGVIGLADALTRTRIDQGQRDMLAMILGSGQALRGLLSDALDLARADSGALKLSAEPFDVRQTIGDGAYLFEALARDKGLTFDVVLDAPAGLAAVADPLRVRQIVSNFISNAIKFTERGGVIVRASLLDLGDGRGRLEVSVQDTGAGFDADTKARLFNRFEQGDSSVTRRYGGTGLGLSISRKLSDLMGGEVSCDSVPGQGSVFRFALDLPVQPAAADAAEASPIAVARPERQLKVLVAEDHLINQKVVRALLGDQIDLTIVGDGAEALEAFIAQTFDVVLMDTHMPVMDGLTAIRRIRSLEVERGAARTPIISLTADAMPQQVDQAIAAGADGHLAKPITAASLHASLAAVLPAAGDEAVSLRVA